MDRLTTRKTYIDSASMAQARRSLPPLTNVLHTTVVPLETTAHAETIEPTIFDSLLAEHFFPVLFAYRLPESSDAVYLQTVNRLKESLSKVLIPFFSFAGRWVAPSPGSKKRKLLCNDEGVSFIEAYMDADVDSVVQASTAFQPVPELQGHSVLGMDAAQGVQQLPPNGAPALFVQVTRFKCGGLVLAVTFNHMHVDAHAFLDFMRAWSDISRTNQTSVEVDHNRARLEVQCYVDLFPEESFDQDLIVGSAPECKPWAMKSVEVGASTIKALKEEAKSSAQGRGWVSTGDCIMAQLFRSLHVLWPSLLGEEETGDEIVVYRVVEGRSRFLDPPAPEVCGNLIACLMPPEIAREELLEMPLSSIASKFHEKLETPKREQWLGREVAGMSLASLGNKDLKHFAVSSWAKFAVYELDFGFGKPYFVIGHNSHHSDPSLLGAAIVLPPYPSSPQSVATLSIISTPDVLQALESDPQFREFFLKP